MNKPLRRPAGNGASRISRLFAPLLNQNGIFQPLKHISQRISLLRYPKDAQSSPRFHNMSEKRRRRRANRTETTDGGKSVSRPSPVSALVPESGVPLRIGEAAFSNQALWVYLGLIAAIAVIYAPVRHHVFLRFDDAPYLTENPRVSGGLTWEGVKWALTTGYAANWFPLTWLSHMLDVQLYGMNPGPHHLTNVFFHTVNSLLLFRLLHRMTGELGKSAFVAGLFATHPLHVESVAWVAERKDVLSTVFWMLTMWAYVEYVRRPGVGRYVSIWFNRKGVPLPPWVRFR